MPTVTYASPVDASPDALFRWHEQPGAFERLVPPGADVRVRRFEGIQDGQRSVLGVRVGPIPLRWVSEHQDYEPGRQFRDVQKRGPFGAWSHLHRMEPAGEGHSRLVDVVTYAPPFGGLGALLGGRRLRRMIDGHFAYRHRVVRADVEAHQRYSDRPRLRIAVSGASGTLGAALVPFLQAGGHEVLRLVRAPAKAADEVYWNHSTGEIEAEKLAGVEAVIHLAGEPVLQLPWTEDKKMKIYGSRARGTALLAQTLARLDPPPKVFLSASGIAYYGDRSDEPVTEAAGPGDGFLSVVARDWEAATAPAAEGGIRTALLRFGAVLTPESGIVATMKPFFRVGLGATAGRPDRHLSWVSREDALHALYYVLMHDDLAGPINVVAPEPVTMQDFARTLGRVLHRPVWLRVPERVVHAFGGEASRALMLDLQAVPARLQASGYRFLMPDLEDALRHVLGRAPVPVADAASEGVTAPV